MSNSSPAEKEPTPSAAAEQETPKKAKKPGIFSIVFSVLAAMIGIQSEENRKRDFEQGSLGNYIFVGIIVVAIFVFSLISIVNSILEESAK